MIRAYDKVYLNSARRVLARMLDYGVNTLNHTPTDFIQKFISSGIAEYFETGDFRYVAGKSGIEIAHMVLEQTGEKCVDVKPYNSTERSPEYWCGWAVAYYQWKSSMSYRAIFNAVPIDEMISMYTPYHEMDVEQFVDEMNKRTKRTSSETNLKTRRKQAKLSQSELASMANIPVRAIQKYERRDSIINHANGNTILRLSKALNCTMEDLMEESIL